MSSLKSILHSQPHFRFRKQAKVVKVRNLVLFNLSCRDTEKPGGDSEDLEEIFVQKTFTIRIVHI